MAKNTPELSFHQFIVMDQCLVFTKFGKNGFPERAQKCSTFFNYYLDLLSQYFDFPHSRVKYRKISIYLKGREQNKSTTTSFRLRK